MVAKIKSGKSLRGALNYNENKVKAGKAVLITANGYLRDPAELNFYDKLFRLADLTQRNLRTKTNTIHISLNFHVNEKIDRETLTNISGEYMRQIGFGEQPYLVYEHFDAGHPHVHIVTTNIQRDGKRISLHYIGEKYSEPAREKIEIQFGLVQAKGNKVDYGNAADDMLVPLIYGNSDTKRVITNIVNEVTRSFKYTSLPELNTILNAYNIIADRGSKGSVMFKKGGLNYWIIDGQGKKIGVPIKASSIHQKPTLKLLECRFKLNEVLRKPLKNALIKKIKNAVATSDSLEVLGAKLKTENVALIVRKNADGRVYGLSYVDHQARVVFNGSDLGYSAASVAATLRDQSDQAAAAQEEKVVKMSAESPSIDSYNGPRTYSNLLDDLLAPQGTNTIHDPFGPKRKKKKRRKLNL